MKVKAWKHLFAPHILERGEDYYLEGAVEELDWDGETISATVQGTDDYGVDIFVSGDCVEDMYCSCPYAEGGNNCKHMAAVLFALEERDSAPTAEKTQGAAEPDTGGALEELVNALGAKDAKALLLRLGREIGAVETQIRLFTTGKVSKKQQKDWLSQISLLRRRYEDRHGFIDYEHADDYTSALDDVLEEAVPMLLTASMPMEAFQVVCAAFQEASDAEMDDSDGGLSMLYESCGEYWREIIQNVDETQRGEMYEWFAKNARNDAWDVGTDVIWEFLFREFQDKPLLRKNLDLLDRWIAESESESNRYFLETCLRYRLHTMEALSVSPEEQETWLRRFYQTPFVRSCLVEKAVAAGDLDGAIRILRESLEIDREFYGLTERYSVQIIDLLRESGRKDALREELRTYVTERLQRGLTYVLELKAMTPPEEWETLREELLKAPGMRNAGDELLLEEGLYRRLMDRLVRANNAWGMDRFAPELKNHFPEEILNFYLPRLRDAMCAASTRKRYAELCARLKTLRSYRGGKKWANDLAGEWRAAYPRRKAMLEELQKAGF